MSSSLSSNAFVFLSLMLLFSVSGALGVITCDSLDWSKCAYTVSSSGTRCVLEKRLGRSGHEEYTCRSSKIEAGGELSDWIESDECVEACGADRDSVGISSDFLWDTAFTGKLCADRCYKNCPNIVDLYFNIAAGEGSWALVLTCRKREGVEMLDYAHAGDEGGGGGTGCSGAQEEKEAVEAWVAVVDGTRKEGEGRCVGTCG